MYILRLAGLTFITQWFWEMLQMPAYAEMADQSWVKAASTCTIATFGDLAIVAFVYTVIAFNNRDWRWGLAPAGTDYVIAALICAGVAIGVETFAITKGQWSYTEAMPRLPNTDVGLLPFLQLAVLVPLTLAVSHLWYKRSTRASATGRL